jgi:hypothetical protein
MQVDQLFTAGLDAALAGHGRAGHAEVGADVARFRARVMTGITPEEYGRTVDVLRRVVRNLASYTVTGTTGSLSGSARDGGTTNL